MPRVKTRTRSNRTLKNPLMCVGCYEEILPGEDYYEWTKRIGGIRRYHSKHGYPRPSMLSNRKTALVEDAILDAQNQLSKFDAVEQLPTVLIHEIEERTSMDGTVTLRCLTCGEEYAGGGGFELAKFRDAHPETFDTFEIDISDIESALSDVADVAEEVAEEYESSAENMPENLQYGAQAEAMRDVANRLRDDFAEQLRSFQANTSVDLPDRDAYQDPDDWRDAIEAAVSEASEEARTEAEDLFAELPEYEG